MVHFPIVFCVSAAFFSVLFALTGNRYFDRTAFYALIGATLTIPVAIVTGLATWRINYMARYSRPVMIKQILSLWMMGVAPALWAWRASDPGVPGRLSSPAAIHLALVVILAAAAITTGYYGGLMTFPVEKVSMGGSRGSGR